MKKGRLKPVEAVLICHDQKNASCVFLSFVFFNLFPFSFFLLQSFFLILGSTNLRRSYLSFSTHRLYDLISCACAVACIVLGPCNQLNPICQATAISSMASQIQWQQQSLSSQVELWWIIHPPKVPGDGVAVQPRYRTLRMDPPKSSSLGFDSSHLSQVMALTS